MASQFETPELSPRSPRLTVLAYSCAGCGQRFTRLVRGDPMLVSLCFACDDAAMWRTSEHLLTLVFGEAP